MRRLRSSYVRRAVDEGSADPETCSDLADGQQTLMRSRIGWQVAHHRRTKRRLTISVWCHRIRIGRLQLSCAFHGLLTGATGYHAMEFPSLGFGTRGSQVRILSPRPIR